MRDYISISQADKYDRCPRAYWWGYVAGVWPPAADVLAFGRNYHEWVAYYHGGRQPYKALRRDVAPLVTAYKERFAPPADLIEKEFELEFKDPDTGRPLGLKIKGVIDLIKDGWIIEHKTASRLYDQSIADHTDQATLYSYAYRKIFGKKEKGIEYRIILKTYPKRGKPPIQVLRTQRGIEDFASLHYQMKEVVKAIKNQEFAMDFAGCFHKQFGKCPYYEVCKQVIYPR